MKNNVINIYLAGIEKLLYQHADVSKIDKIRVYLKGEVDFLYGIPMKRVKSIFKKHIKDFEYIETPDLWVIISILMESLAFEKQIIALTILNSNIYKFDNKKLITAFNIWVNKNIIRNWAVADQTAIHILAKIYENYPIEEYLFRWAKSDNYIFRRTAVVLFAEKFLTDKDINLFLEIIYLLTEEKTEYVQRAAGWSIRNIYNYNKQKYYSFLEQMAHKLPRIMLRNATSHLNDSVRIKILEESKNMRKF